MTEGSRRDSSKGRTTLARRILLLWRQASIALLYAITLAGAYVHFKDEFPDFPDLDLVLRLTCAWSVGPSAIFLLYMGGWICTRDRVLNYAPAFLMLSVYAIVHVCEAANGPADPNTAAHMHTITNPIVYGFPALLIFLFMQSRAISAVKELKEESKGRTTK